jgi:acyl-CoA synthetase (AMP-forming)/AMP-acid ligase II
MSTDISANLIQRVNVGDSLTRTAARYPDRTAVVDGGRQWRYDEFNRWVNQVAGGLLGLGYRRGDALALASGNSAEFLATYYACAKTGIVCVPVNLGWRADEVAYVLGHSEATAMVIEAQLIEAMAPALAQATAVTTVIVAPGLGGPGVDGPGVDGPGVGGPGLGGPGAGTPDGRRWLTFGELAATGSGAEPECFVADRDPITYLYTSGTTSAPKGVVGNHTAIYLESMTMALEARFAPDDRFAALLPMFHTAQLNCHCTPAIMVGATIHVLRRFGASELLELIGSEQLTQIFGLPVMYRAMLDHPAIARMDLSSLRRACYAMAPMPDAQLKRCLEVFGCDFYLLFGQTEMSPTATIFRPEHQLSHSGAVGTPVVNIAVATMSPDGVLLPRGETGEIVYRGPHTMTGYLKDPAATEAAFAHGWFHSGDVGYIDPDGILWFSDRRKDVIKTGGENVASIEVEKAIYDAEPQVAEVVVIGLPHGRWGEAITAVVVAKPGAAISERGLTEAARARLDAYKVPKAVIVVAELPRTSTGKIQKNLLRERFADHYAGS